MTLLLVELMTMVEIGASERIGSSEVSRSRRGKGIAHKMAPYRISLQRDHKTVIYSRFEILWEEDHPFKETMGLPTFS